jgi:hypothetical protein
MSTESTYEPFADKPKRSPLEDAENARRALIKAYRATFSSGAGRVVLADLKYRFGFDKWDAADTEESDKIVRRVFSKGPLYYIETMRLANPNQPKRKSRNETTTETQPPA